MLGNFLMKKKLFKIFKNKIVFLSERLIFTEETDSIFYPFSTSHCRMFDIIRTDLFPLTTWSGRRMFNVKSLAGFFFLLIWMFCFAFLIYHLQYMIFIFLYFLFGFFIDWRKRAFSKALAMKQRPEPFRPSKESRSWHRRCSKWRPSMRKLVGGRERLEPGHALTSQAHALLWNDIRNTCNLWLAEGSRC